MASITRRKFLFTVATGVGAVVLNPLLTACSAKRVPPTEAPLPTTKPPPATPVEPTAAHTDISPAATAAPTAEPVGIESVASATPVVVPDLVVARQGEPEELVRKALAALGGIERFVPPEASVIIKPNMCNAYHTYEYASTTNPWVVGALVRLCFEGGARRVRVMDNPFAGNAEAAYVKSGIEEQVKAAGGEMALMSGFKFASTEIPEGLDLRRCDIFEDILKADVLINVPIAKHHSLARLTLGMKNLMGVIRDRPAMHSNLGQRLADLASRLRPALTVVDAVRILRDHGPTGGSLDDVQELDTVIASPDIVAADSYAATLFGLKPEDLSYVQAGAAMGLGRSDLNNLRIEEVNVGA